MSYVLDITYATDFGKSTTVEVSTAVSLVTLQDVLAARDAAQASATLATNKALEATLAAQTATSKIPYKYTETDVVLANSSKPYQFINTKDTSRTVNLPDAPLDGQIFYVTNLGPETIDIKSFDNTQTLIPAQPANTTKVLAFISGTWRIINYS